MPDSSGLVSITEGFLYDMLPVNSTVRMAKITGFQLKNWLEKEMQNVFAKDPSKRIGGWVIRFEGMQVTFKVYEEFGKRVQTVVVNGQPLDFHRVYTICACEREGDPATMLCRIPNVLEASNSPFSLHDVMKDYLAKNSPVNPVPKGNAKVLDVSQTLLTQVFGVDYKFS